MPPVGRCVAIVLLRTRGKSIKLIRRNHGGVMGSVSRLWISGIWIHDHLEWEGGGVSGCVGLLREQARGMVLCFSIIPTRFLM